MGAGPVLELGFGLKASGLEPSLRRRFTSTKKLSGPVFGYPTGSENRTGVTSMLNLLTGSTYRGISTQCGPDCNWPDCNWGYVFLSRFSSASILSFISLFCIVAHGHIGALFLHVSIRIQLGSVPCLLEIPRR